MRVQDYDSLADLDPIEQVAVSVILGVGFDEDSRMLPGSVHLLEHLIFRSLRTQILKQGQVALSRFHARTYASHMEIGALGTAGSIRELLIALERSLTPSALIKYKIGEIANIKQEIHGFSRPDPSRNAAIAARKVGLNAVGLSSNILMGLGEPEALVGVSEHEISRLLDLALDDYQIMTSVRGTRELLAEKRSDKKAKDGSPESFPLSSSEIALDEGWSGLAIQLSGSDRASSTAASRIETLWYGLGVLCAERLLQHGQRQDGRVIAQVGPFGVLRSGSSVDLIFGSRCDRNTSVLLALESARVIGHQGIAESVLAARELDLLMAKSGDYGELLDYAVRCFRDSRLDQSPPEFQCFPPDELDIQDWFRNFARRLEDELENLCFATSRS